MREHINSSCFRLLILDSGISKVLLFSKRVSTVGWCSGAAAHFLCQKLGVQTQSLAGSSGYQAVIGRDFYPDLKNTYLTYFMKYQKDVKYGVFYFR